MKLLVRIVLVITFILCIASITHAQTNPSYVPTITPKAPDAAALMKFTDIPVSPYTGSSSVSVPIYTIKAKGISIPISVDYHTGGIRLDEEASATGLGWALSAGGMISRTINDKDDLGGLYFGQPVPQYEGNLIGYQPANGPWPNSNMASLDSIMQANCPTCSFAENCPSCPIASSRYVFDFQCSYNVNFEGGHTGNYFSAFSPIGDSPVYDLEPDTYSYNFLGKSGKFIIKRDSTIVLEKQDNIKIRLVWAGNNLTFIITDENGNKFYFNQTQSCHPAWQSNATPTSWYLSQIVTQQNDKITFNYSGYGVTHVASQNTQTYEAFGPSQGLFDAAHNETTYDNVNLSSIDYADGHIQFFSDSSRLDLQGGYKLDSIRILSKTATGLKYLKSYKFYYTYFISAQSGTTTAPNGDNAWELDRLRLDSVKEMSGGNSLKPYSFVYNGAPFPYGEKHSYAIDHWGYYNGAGNTQLIPTTTAYYMGNNYSFTPIQFSYTGANREPSTAPTYYQVFSLHKVTYPTGGSSIFNYEQNTYDYNKSMSKQVEYPQQVMVAMDTIIHLQSTNFTAGSASGQIDFSKLFPVIPDGTGGYNATVTVTFVSTNHSTGWPAGDSSATGKLYLNFNGNITDMGQRGLTQSANKDARSLTYQITVASNTAWNWTAHWDSSWIPPADFSLMELEVRFNALKTVVQSNPTLTAGGLRVQSIIDSTAIGIAKERIWNYHYGTSNQYTNGVLMSFPSYVRMEEQSASGGGHVNVMVLFSSSNTATTSAIGGNIVGYSQVTETTVNPSNNADNGKIVYNFINTPDSVISYNTLRMPGIPNIGNNLNGSEISKVTYKDSAGFYRKVAETDNFYHTTNHNVFYSAKYRSSVDGNKNGTCNGIVMIPNDGIAEFFPSIKSERVLLDSTRNITYDQNDTTKFLVASNKSFYDNPAHYLPTRTKFVDSKGTTHVSKVTYPQDYIPTGFTATGNAILDTLINHNMVAENIEKRDSIYYQGQSSGYVTGASESRYKQLSTGPMVMDKEYKLDIINPVTNFVPMSVSGSTYSHDSRYRQLISFDAYNSANDIAQYTMLYQPSVAIIWDYKGVSPVAQVKGAGLRDVAYTSFETDSTGNWTCSGARDSVTAALTGTRSYNLTSGSVSKSGLTAATTYVVSYWTKNASPLTITGTITGYPVQGATLNGWTYYEHQVTGQTTITLSGTGNIDELRLYPSNAEMTSYTYSPQVGVTSINDARAGINFYEYDGFQRLVNIKDQYGNIVKNYVYHYIGQ